MKKASETPDPNAICSKVDPETWSIFSDIYKDENGFRPRMPLTCKEVNEWLDKRRKQADKKDNWKVPFAELLDGTKIFIVDGDFIRDNIYVDFVLGGHGYVYDFVPKDEIWVEQVQDHKDEQYNLTHEIIEYLLMKLCDKDYDSAHEFTAHVEDILRRYDNQKTVSKATKFFHMPQVRQNTDNTCGAACASSIMAYYGNDIVESDISKAMNTTDEGVDPDAIIEYFNNNKLTATKEELTPETLKSHIDEDVPVIVELQAWGDKNDYSKDYKNGHYVVAIGYDDNGFFFMDPSQFGYTYLETDDLNSRWHDENNGEKDQNLGIIVKGEKPDFTIEDAKVMGSKRPSSLEAQIKELDIKRIVRRGNTAITIYFKTKPTINVLKNLRAPYEVSKTYPVDCSYLSLQFETDGQAEDFFNKIK
ncbi:MAG: C39 family peptidase [Candidatus Nanoarchaeia archaeon]|nr:C39 family peptidase [Candidatus Nanoarchaeia archaeon]